VVAFSHHFHKEQDQHQSKKSDPAPHKCVSQNRIKVKRGIRICVNVIRIRNHDHYNEPMERQKDLSKAVKCNTYIEESNGKTERCTGAKQKKRKEPMRGRHVLREPIETLAWSSSSVSLIMKTECWAPVPT
jgi:hypothetical protein